MLIKRLLNTLLIVFLTGNLLVACAGAAGPFAPTATATIATEVPTVATPPIVAIPSLPSGDRWLTHLKNELLPFWTIPTALGNPIGAFSATRCNNGSLANPKEPCKEFKDNSWVMSDQYYVVVISRQIYGYGVAFQLTGDPKYLQYMKAGVEFFRSNFLDQTYGGAYSYFDGKQWGPDAAYRTTQELAYSMVGLSFCYYLTRDPEV